MFKLSASLSANRGVYCGPEGLYLGPIALIEKREGAYLLRPKREIAAIFAAAYSPDLELADRIAGLHRTTAALQRCSGANSPRR